MLKQLIVTIAVLAPFTPSWASDKIPDCMDRNDVVEVNNEQVLEWEATTKNQFRARGHIQGQIVTLFPNKNGHQHFEVQIGKDTSDSIEVIYNTDFGEVSGLTLGDDVEACGDYITSTAQAGPYPPSPAGAIIHWVHFSPSPKKHDSGFMVINGKLYGQGKPKHPKGENQTNSSDS